MSRLLMFSLVVSGLWVQSCTEKEDAELLSRLMATNRDTFGHILDFPDSFKVQIIYTRIQRDAKNVASFRSYYYNHHPDEYFYPASTVKLPACVLALEKLRTLGDPLDRDSPMLTDSSWRMQEKVWHDSSSVSGRPSIGHYIKKILLISDNDAFNRLYEFIGQGPFNQRMRELGFTNTRITHRLSVFLDLEENAHTNQVRLVSGEDTLWLPPMVNTYPRYADKPILMGKAYMSGDSLVNEPMNFQFKNFFPLEEQQKFLRTLFFPESVAPESRYKIDPEDYLFLYRFMSMPPSESGIPGYSGYEDHYVRFMMYGTGEYQMDPGIRIFNKVGDAYGFLIDNAYIVDTDKKIEFLLSAVIYCNSNQILNDGVYDYDSVGMPFLTELGQLIYNYELQNPHPVKPDLSHLDHK